MKKVIQNLLDLIYSGSKGKKKLIPIYVNRSYGFTLNGFRKFSLLLLFVFVTMFTTETNAQILKKIGKKIEREAERRAEQKVDRSINKGFDKVEDGVDNSLKENQKEGVKGSQNSANAVAPDPSKASVVNFLTDNEPYSLKEAETAKMNGGLIMVSANCDDYIWFKEGATMSFKTTLGSGKKQEVSHSKMVVKKVYNQSGKKVSEVNVSADEGFDMDFKYLCAGNNLYVDMAASIKQALSKAGQDNPESNKVLDNMEMGFDEGFMDIPKNMYPGQKLNDINFTMKTKASGADMTIITNLTERKVGAKEKITTPAGTFECMPITGVRNSSMKVMGINRNMGKPTTETIWYAPGIGMVKSENYDEKGKVEMTQVLTEFKR
ncbi:MAG: hypothetical protein ABIN48_02515 [Ginsengibacter sp.]